ncbi:MAG: hypothetical protein SRB2_02135 [Desulfobacteraceae bacterium Eth-SRB2]|nr:MAG: hypothetical protein SRB2_02135 [Desulfobacteraceae bacterium Eth-SRB2]
MLKRNKNSSICEALRKAWRAVFKPPERFNVWQWAEKYLILSEKITSYPGLYRTELTPYVKGPLEAFHTHERIVLCFGSQVAKTTTLFCIIGYIIDQDPGPAMIIYPTGDLGRRVSKRRLQVVINDSPSLARHKTSVDDDFQLMSYTLDRLSITLVGSNSPAAVSSDPIRYLIMDEVDKFAMESRTEADALSLALERTKSFWNSRTIITSTPTTSDGNVWHQFLLTDQRYYHVPCPKCGHFQKLIFDNLRWPDLKSIRIRDLDNRGWFECESCNGRIEDKDKTEMVNSGKWIAEKPEERWAGFHLNSLYALWSKTKFGAIAAEYLRSKPYPDKARNFRNSWLALPYDPEEEGKNVVEEETLAASIQTYQKNTVPAVGSALFMGVDVQERELYYVVRSWARKDGILQSWLINWGKVENFHDLLPIVQMGYPGTESQMLYKVQAAGIDSRYRTSEVYEFCKIYPMFIPIKGFRQVRNETGSIPWKEYQTNKRDKFFATKYFMINTVFYKEKIFAEINQDTELPKIWHLPGDVDSTFLRHMSSEKEVRKRDAKGQWIRSWVTKKGCSANHFLDGVVYSSAIADIHGVGFLKEYKGGDETQRISGRRVRSTGI